MAEGVEIKVVCYCRRLSRSVSTIRSSISSSLICNDSKICKIGMLFQDICEVRF